MSGIAKGKRVVGVGGQLPGQLDLFAELVANAGKRSPRSGRSAQSAKRSEASTTDRKGHESEPPVGRHSDQRERSGLAGVQGHAVPSHRPSLAAPGLAAGTSGPVEPPPSPFVAICANAASDRRAP